MTTTWEYASFLVATVPRFSDIAARVVYLNEKPWDFVVAPFAAQDMLNLLGKRGWELVGFSTIHGANSDEEILSEYVLKRRFEGKLDDDSGP